MQRKWTHPKPTRMRRGSAAVEAALILPMLVFVGLGAVDIAQYINLSQLVANASREGARSASRITTDSVDEVEDDVMDYLAQCNPQLTQAQLQAGVQVSVQRVDNVAIAAGDLSSIESKTALAIQVTFDFSSVRWISGPSYWNGNANESTTFCRRE